MKKNDRKYRQGRSKNKQSTNEKIVTYAFAAIVIMLLALILHNLSLSL
jgi:hypothetical protein